MMQQLFSSAICILVCSSIASAQVTFEQKFPEETKFVTQRESKVTQTLALTGGSFESKVTTFQFATATIGKRDANGTLKIAEKMDSMQSDLMFPGGTSLQFDSANPDKKSDNPMFEAILEIFRTAYRSPVTIERDAKNKIVSVKLPEGDLERLSEEAKAFLAPERLKKNVERLETCLPDGAVKTGDMWERATESTIGGGQTLSFRTNFEYAGTIEKDGIKLEKITGKAFEVSYAVSSNAVFQVPKSDLKVVDSDSTFLFDRELGSIVKRNSNIRIKGTLTLVINNMELPGELDLTLEEMSTRQK